MSLVMFLSLCRKAESIFMYGALRLIMTYFLEHLVKSY